MSVAPLAISVSHKTSDKIVYFFQVKLIDWTGVIRFGNCHFHALSVLIAMLHTNLCTNPFNVLLVVICGGWNLTCV